MKGYGQINGHWLVKFDTDKKKERKEISKKLSFKTCQPTQGSTCKIFLKLQRTVDIGTVCAVCFFTCTNSCKKQNSESGFDNL